MKMKANDDRQPKNGKITIEGETCTFLSQNVEPSSGQFLLHVNVINYIYISSAYYIYFLCN